MPRTTPGEWRVVGSSQIYAGDRLIAIAAIKDVPDLDERMANLTKMAAAEDMYHALIDAKEQILHLKSYIPDKADKTTSSTVAHIDAAIVKATK